MRRPWWGLLAVALVALLVSPLARASAAGSAWQPGAHIPGVFDVAGPRGDGRLVVVGTYGLYLLNAGDRRTRFAPAYSPSDNEAYIAMSPGLSVSTSHCDFARDAIAALDTTPGQLGVVLISPAGRVSRLASISGVAALSGITFDVTGRFGHRILVTGSTPGGLTQISAIDCLGNVTTVGTVTVLLEGGIAVAPSTFGTLRGPAHRA